MLRAGISILIVALGACGCGRDRRAAPSEARELRQVAHPVARVGERALGATEVAARMKEDGVDARTAVESLVDEMLLAREARRRGIALDREGERAVERVMVRAMLHDFEAELTPQDVSEEEVRADFEAHRDKLPSEATRLEDVESEIRLRLSQRKRFEKLSSIIRAREADGLVTYDDEGVALLLAMPGLPERVD